MFKWFSVSIGKDNIVSKYSRVWVVIDVNLELLFFLFCLTKAQSKSEHYRYHVFLNKTLKLTSITIYIIWSERY